jgi:hypothetical protein
MDDIRIPPPSVVPSTPVRPIGSGPDKRRERRPERRPPQPSSEDRQRSVPGGHIDEYASPP